MASDFVLAPDYTFDTTEEFKTSVVEFENGTEQRAQKWNASRKSWKLVYRNRSSSDLSTILTLFQSKKGALTSFTWDNPIDSTTYTVRFKEDSLKYSCDCFGIYNIEFELIEVK